MIPLIKLGLSIAAVFGTAIPAATAAAPTPPVAATRIELFQRLKEAGFDSTKYQGVLAGLAIEEITGLLAEFKKRAGFFGLASTEKQQLQELVEIWYGKVPDAAVAWLQGLSKDDDRGQLLGPIVTKLAATDLDAAVGLLRKAGRDQDGRIEVPLDLLQKALAVGEDKLIEVCRLGLAVKAGVSGNGLNYPEVFDFKRVLDGLLEAQAAFGHGAGYDTLPSNLVTVWTQRNPQAAWAWLRQGKSIYFNEKKDFFEAYAKSAAPDEVGRFLASVFDPAAQQRERYDGVQISLMTQPSAALLDGFLQASPGERGVHLEGLFDLTSGWNGDSPNRIRELLLERMTPVQKVEVLRRAYGNGITGSQRNELTPMLRRVGYGEEEIRTLLPVRKQ